MNFALKHAQMKAVFKIIKFKRKFNITSNYDSFCCISYSKICGMRRNSQENLKIAKEFFSQEQENNFENTFGNLEGYETKFEKLREDPEDVEEYKRRKAGQGKTIFQYILEIQNHLKNHDYDKAINVLEVDMVNDAKPSVPYIYRLLISYNGRIGNIEEAYRLYIRYKKRQGKTNGAMITSLFNACANSKNSLYALEKANAIRESLSDKNYAVNLSNYNAMLKAFGRHGDLKTSLKIVDEVLQKKDKVKIETYGFLLQACASDANSGLRHALIVWRKMIQYRLKPRVFEFNIMLRCVRDCFLGEPELLQDFIKELQNESNKFYKRKVLFISGGSKKERKVLNIPLEKNEVLKYFPNESHKQDDALVQKPELTNPESGSSILTLTESVQLNQCEAANTSSSIELVESEKEVLNVENLGSTENFNSEVPNLITTVPSFGSATFSTEFTKPYMRLLLLGGIKGFFEAMSEFDAKPNMKTFTLLLEVLPSTTEEEENLMKIMDAHKIKRDSVFFNVLIKRRCLRGNLSSIQDCLLLMQKENIAPDIITFGVIAIGCNTLESACELINSVHNFGYRLNTTILETLLRNALKILDWNYIRTILVFAKEDEVELSTQFTAILSRGVAIQKRINEKVTPTIKE